MRFSTVLIVIFILFLSLFLRLWNVPSTLLFHYDQGLHSLAIWDIWKNKDFALLGHPTDVEGIYHGALFYYLMIPIYALSGGSPITANIFQSIINVLGVAVLFYTGRVLFKNDAVGLLAALLWGVSFLAVSYARWLSNVTLIPFFSILFYFLIAEIIKNKKTHFWPFAFLLVGIISQFNGAIGFFFIPLLIFLVIKNLKSFLVNKVIVLLSIVGFLLPAGPLILFELRHQFFVTKSITRMFTSPEGFGVGGSIVSNVTIFLKEIVNLFFAGSAVLAVLTIVILIGGVVFLLLTRKVGQEERLLFSFILIPLAGLLLYKRGTPDFFFIAILPAFCLLLSRILVLLWSKERLRLAIVLFMTLFLIDNITNAIHFFSQPSHALIPIGTNSLITLEDRKKAVDFIYNQANGESFGLWIYTIPYFKFEPWDYVFVWYGQGKYGYIPDKDKNELMFTLWERDPNEPGRLMEWQELADKELGNATSRAKFHDVNVEMRER